MDVLPLHQSSCWTNNVGVIINRSVLNAAGWEIGSVSYYITFIKRRHMNILFDGNFLIHKTFSVWSMYYQDRKKTTEENEQLLLKILKELKLYRC